MKTTFKHLAIILVVLIATMQTAQAVEKTKKYHQSWPASEIQSLNISNKFGEVKIKNDGGTDITIDVLVTVDYSGEKKVDEMLDKIDVSFSKSGSTAKAETSIGTYNYRGKFSIDYIVNVPSDKNLKVSNKYGNVIVNKLTALGEFDLQYGNLTAGSLTGSKTRLDLAYGNAGIEETGDFEIMISYSNITLGTTGNFKVDSKYSSVELDKAKDIQIVSKYDKLKFGEVVSLTADTKYSNLRIARLTKSLEVGAGYGGIKVENVDPTFESISIVNSYGQISLGMKSASYAIDASCSYCGISYPEERFKGNKMKEDTQMQINGKVGSAGGGTVKIESRYGEIKLNEQ